MDETGLFYGYVFYCHTQTIVHLFIESRMAPDRGLSDNASADVKGKKTCLTYAFTVNTNGSDKLPVFVIGCWKKPHALGNCTHRC